MKILGRLLAVFCLLTSFSLGSAALAGEAYDTKIKCPLGGKKTKITSTTSCGTYGTEFAMSLRRPSTCDFVTRLPVCEREDFPIYRDNNREEISLLKKFVETDEYQSSKSQSRYFRAYVVENELRKLTSEKMFWLLQSGFFYDPEQTYGNAEYYKVYRDVANAYYPEADDDDKHFILLASAFARVHSDDPSKALSMLDREAKLKRDDQTIWSRYSGLVRACVASPKSAECNPEYIVDLVSQN